VLCGSGFWEGIVVLYISYHCAGPSATIVGKEPGDRSAGDWINPKIPGNNGSASAGNPAAAENRERRGRSQVYRLQGRRGISLGC
jgi:hypothetical protein